jgi:TPR repeat protein
VPPQAGYTLGRHTKLGLLLGSWEVTLFKSLKGLLGSISGSGGNDRLDTAPPADLLARAEAGDAEAANELGLWYANNQPDSKKVEFWFRRAADAGLPRAQHNMGVLAMRSGQTDDAIGWFRLAVAGGWRNSHFALGSLLEEQADRKGALAAFEMGAQQECEFSQDALGRLALEEETEASYKVARYWSEKAAQQGYAPAQARLGEIFHEGLGVARDPQQAASWFLQAAQRGHPGAQMMIGVACHLGIGVEAHRLRAARWLMASAAQGNPFAQAYLPRVDAELTPDEKLLLKQEMAGPAPN